MCISKCINFPVEFIIWPQDLLINAASYFSCSFFFPIFYQNLKFYAQ